MPRSRCPAAFPVPQAFDMTPMIDVTFQLIIFFMLVMDMSSVRTEQLQQPAARNLSTGPDPGEVVVNVAADGRLRVSGKTLGDTSLEDLFEAQRRARRTDFPVLIRADRSAAFEHIQKIMLMAQAHGGVTRVRFGAVKEMNR